LDRVFLDANVLYSAAYLERSGFARLTSIDDVQLLSSAYAIEEARRNLVIDRPEALSRLTRLVSAVSIIEVAQGLKLPDDIRRDMKDIPILLAAIHGRADYLLTGDARHFAHLYGKRIQGVLVLRLSVFFRHPGYYGKSERTTALFSPQRFRNACLYGIG
jgi:uncharacterized protein